MIIRCLHHLLPPREGGKEVIISHPNSLLHKEGSHAPVSCDNSQHSVGSACFIPSPNSNRKRPVSPICLHWHVRHSCRLRTARLKPRSSFWATLRALRRSRTDDYHSQHLHMQSGEISWWGHIWPKTICQRSPPSHLLPSAAQQLWKQARRVGSLSFPYRQQLCSLRSKDSCLLPQEAAKAEQEASLCDHRLQ